MTNRTIPKRAAAVLVACLVGCLVIASCQGRAPSQTTPGSPAGLAPSQPATYQPTAGPNLVHTRVVPGLGRVLTDAAGNTIYHNNGTPYNKVPRCVGVCTNVWHSVLVRVPDVPRHPAGLSLELSVLPRPGGLHQLTIDGHRAYTFVGDERPGEARGDGFVTGTGPTKPFVWRAVRVPAGAPASVPLDR
ncbi:hypothetical protein SAMN05421678_116146 [Actinopolymorpha cephalotaxi]|uniref:Lipoprotein with Yx(FWY)xxD motif n=1 Tax=Actinopolymorpha cephalotaxi TaxID=504797 RepID=A0A1I2ZJH4_9ACTN|nr:hypothetical protein [Actinopolymorpha cephalotaxi]NYH82033.1 putative lipoprotein with Yx(FWY)xxD motif [Actinopolymorpha cephalotaxi]SFH37997.1 hypothetical protein SAMN05421678_116146 [Actinopolymorpha cephalotaxi]